MFLYCQQKMSRLASWLFLTLAIVFFYLPLVVLIIFSFNTTFFPSPWEKFTITWYKELFASQQLWASFYNSLIVATSASIISILMALFFLYLSIYNKHIINWVSIFYGNLFLPEMALGACLISYFTLFKIPLGLTTIIIAHTILGIGFSVPLLSMRFLEIDPRISEASYVLGAHSMQTFLYIILPLMRPTLMATGLIIFIISFDDFVLSYFCSGNSVQTLSPFLFSSLRFGVVSPIINAFTSIVLLFSIFFTTLFFICKPKRNIF